ncbi:hypothetical protein PAMA_020075 [Pampus argenteus]
MKHYINVMDQNPLPKPKLKKFRCLMYVTPVIVILSLILLHLWTFRERQIPSPRQVPPKYEGKQVLRGEKVSFMGVNGTKTLLLSAYMEHRKEKQVRVIAVALSSETPVYRCLLYCEEKQYISEGVGEFHDDYYGFSYGTVHIMCPLPSGCETPSLIAVTTAAASSEDLHHAVFLEVKNQKAESVSLPYNFTVCISTMFDFTNVLQLVQSLEMMQLLGVNRVVIYKTSCSPETQRVLDYYTETGLVEVIPWTISRYLKPSRFWQPGQDAGDLHYYGQVPALNDCVYRYMYQTRYMSLQDIDELILPQSVNSWLDLLPLLENKYGIDTCYMFANYEFPNSITLPPPASQTLPSQNIGWQKVPGVNILAHLHHKPIDKYHYINVKIIVNPRAVFRPAVHGLLESVNGCSRIDTTIAGLYHTSHYSYRMQIKRPVEQQEPRLPDLPSVVIARKSRIPSPRPATPKHERKRVPRGEKVSFMGVNGTKTLLLSAYMEHRKGRQVRVIAVALRTQTPVYRCLLYCEEKQYISEGVGKFHDDHFDFAYGTVHIMCPLLSGCETPSLIAVTTAAASSEDLHHAVFLEVKNQKAESVSLPYNFTVCISTMFDFTNVLQLVQSLEMMQLLGVNRVVIYKTSCSPETQRVLDYYTETGLVEVIPWTISRYVKPSKGWLPLHGPGDLHYYGQIPALNDCIYRYMYQTRYVSLQDIDELILPQSVDSWLDLLPLLEKKYGVDKCYMFENNVFPNTVALPPPASQTLPPPASQTRPPPASQTLPPQSISWKKVPGVNILVHLHHEPITEENHNNGFKIIVNPRAVFRPTVHGLLESEKGCSWIDRDIVRMYHTRPAVQKQLKPDQLIYDGRLQRYSTRLTSAVNTGPFLSAAYWKMAVQISKKRKFVSDGIFKAELNEFLTRELAEDGYSGVEVRVTPTRTEIIILATRTQNVLGEKGRRIRELTAVVQKRFGFPEGSVELYAEKVATRGLCAIAQAESLRYKLLGGLAVRRACYGVLRFIMESGAKGCEVVVSGKLRGQRAKSMKFVDGLMIHSGDPVNYYVDTAVRHVLLRQGEYH